MAGSTEVTKATYSTGLDRNINVFLPMVQRQMVEDGVNFDDYSRDCVVAAISEIVSMTHNAGIEMKEINGSNMNDILLNVAKLKLNANAVPRECYFQVRNVNVTKKGQSPVWEKQIEFNIEGDGYDALASRFGRDVKKIHPFWQVREGDAFTYPKRRGIELTPPEWEPTGQGKTVRVVYPVEYMDGHVEYLISERADVVKNLAAHINNNMMNETFGICADRYKANEKQKQEIAARKKAIMQKVKDLGDVDAVLDDEELQAYISPSWSEMQSRESMIIRKMRNNVTKKIPKDFGNSSVARAYNIVDDVTYREVTEEIQENANKEVWVPNEPAAIEDKGPEIPLNIPQTEKEKVVVEQGVVPDFMKD